MVANLEVYLFCSCLSYSKLCPHYYLVTCYFNVTVDLRDVKEVRPGKISKDFDKWPDELKKVDQQTCFVIFYGKEFRLKTVSVAGNYD